MNASCLDACLDVDHHATWPLSACFVSRDFHEDNSHAAEQRKSLIRVQAMCNGYIQEEAREDRK